MAVLRALATALVLMCIAPACASAARGMEVGVQDDGVFLGHYSNRDTGFALAKRLHATRVRVMVQWAKVARGRRKYDFAPFDALAAAARANGMKLQLVLTGPAPAFATANHRVGPVRPNARRFGQFAAAAARHFKGTVDRYSIWNEPNHRAWLAPVASAPRVYRALYAAGYRAVKSADPRAKVLIGETVPYDIHRGHTATAPLRFLRSMMCVDARYRRSRCGRLKADGYAHHPYDFTHAPSYRYPGGDNVTIGVLGRLTKALAKLRRIHALSGPRKRMDVYLTEYGYFATGRRRISERRRAKYLPQAFRMALRAPHVREMLQYALVRPPAGQAGEAFSTFLATRGGKPLPAFRALEAFARSHPVARSPH